MPPKIKLEELFPDLPTAPPSGYLFMCQEKKNVIDAKVKEEANGVTDKPTLFKLRGQVSKTLWDGKCFSFCGKRNKSLYGNFPQMLTIF